MKTTLESVQVVTKISRQERSRLRGLVEQSALPLHFVGPKQFSGYASRTGYFFVTRYEGRLVMLSKLPARTRDEARRIEALKRFGRRATQIVSPKAQKSAA